MTRAGRSCVRRFQNSTRMARRPWKGFKEVTGKVSRCTLPFPSRHEQVIRFPSIFSTTIGIAYPTCCTESPSLKVMSCPSAETEAMVPDSTMKSGNHPNAADCLLGIVPLNLGERRLIQQAKHILQVVSLPELRKEVLTMVSSQRPHERVPVLPADATQQRPMTPIQSWLLHCSLHTSDFRNGTEGLREPIPTGRISLLRCQS